MKNDSHIDSKNEQKENFKGSRILRDYIARPANDGGDDIVRSSWRHEEQGRNVLPLFLKF